MRGCLTGDTVWYGVGLLWSEAIQNSASYRVVGPRVEGIAQRFGPWQIVGARFMYGTRVATMLFWGVRGLSFPRFVVTDLVGCVVWAGLLGTLGYAGSSGASLLLGEVKRVEFWLLGAALAAAALVLAARSCYSLGRVRI